jgi:hypothetical protein
VQREYAVKYEKAVDKSNMDDRFASFGNLSITSCPCASEIQEYLSLPIKNVKDLLKWWIDNKHIYLNLHHMALDYLSIHGKSSHLFH